MRKLICLLITFLLISNYFVPIIQSKENETLVSQPEFIQNYLGEKGYIENSELTKEFKSNDIVGTITPLKSINPEKTFGIMSTQENEQTFIINLKNPTRNEKIDFFLKVEKIEDKTILTMFNDEGGVKIDFTNKIVLETWSSHNTCGYWTCVGNYIIQMLTNSKFWTTCGVACLDPTEIACLTCAINWGARGFFDCLSDSCSWYRCKQDCSDFNWLSPYYYYCANSNLRKYKWYYAYKCPDDINYGKSGNCVYDSLKSGSVNDTYVMTCSNVCENGVCVDQGTTTTTTIPLIEEVEKLKERVSQLEQRADFFDVLTLKFRDIICQIKYMDSFCLPKCPRPYTCSSSCEDDITPSICYDRTTHPEYYCSSGKVCCESQRKPCPS